MKYSREQEICWLYPNQNENKDELFHFCKFWNANNRHDTCEPSEKYSTKVWNRMFTNSAETKQTSLSINIGLEMAW